LQFIQSMNCTAHQFSYTIKVHPFRHLAKVQVAGSNPVSRSKPIANSPQRIRASSLLPRP
jgi:hypothetical protein